ncbi:hypothetical protein [Clostridium grantii]|uniref:DUF4046 domain-containing protein n=1 Tax=Clostridium grantii DSM 8605 TaxID=1121316 RepID=A0A1M5RAY1_9CLOT|nr:hypothetical protein [Clostridium grantii]SHH23465.1 hypothetical protein SAMN02745207_00428 [Clostridium grantii DSM 8605]
MFCYPEKNFKPWDFVNAPNCYWQGEKGKENAIAATKWLLEEKLNWSHDDIIEKLNHQIFIDNNLLGMLKKAFNASLHTAMEATYPGEFKKWELGTHVVNGSWNKDEGIIAVKWLLEDKLKWSNQDIKKKYCKQIYKDNNLYGMLQACFNSSPFEALNSAYPNKFIAWELPMVPRCFWNSKKNCIVALKWLTEEKLTLDSYVAKKSITKSILLKYVLASLCGKYTMS